ncbi:MAG: hypothetical protein CSH36_08660 [Thalassolituus sp.]|nr:MAG: hypothetical protein CSH36_08660 [Thalassolituus sp.]
MTDSLFQPHDNRVLRSQAHNSDVIVSDTFLRAYLDTAAERGADPDTLLALVGYDRGLDEGIAELDLQMFLRLLELILEECGNDGLGIEVGLRIPPTAFGMVGLAAMSSATVRDSLKVSTRYWHLLRTGLDMEVIFGDDWSSLRLIEQQEVPGNICCLLSEVAVISAYRVMELVLGKTDAAEIHLAQERPAYISRYEDRLPTMIFGASEDSFRFSSSILDRPLPTASQMGLHHALEQCHQMEDELTAGDLPTLMQITQYLRSRSGNFPGLEELAAQFNSEPRALRRYLESQGSSYRELLEDAKCAMAKDLLMNNAYGISAIADELGYQGGGNFSRAFRRWTGVSPAEYRQQMAGLGPAQE